MIKNLILTFILPETLWADDAKEITSTIKNVVVYFRGSSIERTTLVDIKQGVNNYKLIGLSESLIPTSIQLKLPEYCNIMSISTSKNYMVNKNPSLNVKKLEDSLNTLKWDLKKLNLETQALQTEKSLLTSNVNRIGNLNYVNAAELSSATTFYRTKIAEIDEKILKNEKQLEKTNQLNSQVSNQVTAIKGSDQKYCTEILLTIKSDKPSSEKLEFSYYEPNSGWNPKYDVRKLSKNKSLRLDYKAAIVNLSHEDWEKTNLKLSTSDPSKDNSKPIIEPWALSFGYNRKGNVYQKTSSGNEGLLETVEMKKNSSYSYKDKLNDNTETIEISEFSTDFIIKDQYSILSNGLPVTVDIKQHIIDSVSYYYYTVPKIRPEAFIIARVTDWAEYNILDGIASVYIDDKYVGKTPIETTTANDTLDITLGIDDKVVVNKVKKKDHNSQKMIGLNRRESFDYQIIVRNNNAFPLEIEVVDQVPISQENEIEIDVDEISKAEYDKTSGKLKWILNITPNNNQKIDIRFSVKYPRNKLVLIRPNRKVVCPKFYY